MELGWNTLQELMDEARALAAKHDQAAARIRADRDLSDEGKATRLAENEMAQRKAVAALKVEAAKRIDGARSFRAAELANLRKQRFEERVKLLGPEEYARLLQAELAVMTPAQIQSRYEMAVTPWEKALVQGYGSIELRRRTANRVPTAAEWDAQNALSEGEPERVVVLEREIQRLDDFDVAEMDRHAAADRLAANMGLKTEFVRQADYGGEAAA